MRLVTASALKKNIPDCSCVPAADRACYISDTMAIAGFILFALGFMLIGLWATRRQTSVANDYLLAGGTVSPLLTALSAAATKNSGYMFIGLIGYIYQFGLSAVWLVCGFLFGDLISFFFVHRKLRQAARETGALSFAQLISRWNGGNYRSLQLAIGVITLVFLTTYAGAQLSAGGKALHSIFDWPVTSGAWIGAGLILAYCMSGGLRASIWTDAAQSVLMLGAMLLLLTTALHDSGGVSSFIENLDRVSPTYLNLGTDRFGSVGATALFAFGWLFNGLGVVGQPQVMVRFMALDRPEHTTRTRIYYFLWSGLFLSVTLIVGLATRLFIVDSASFDAELALPTLAQNLLPGLAVGIVLGGIFAATLSTVDSQILSCSAVLSEDFKFGKGLRAKRLSTLGVVTFALLIALCAPANVFTLVIIAWSALACSLGPLVIVHALGNRPTQRDCLVMMAVGFSTAMIWRFLGLNQFVYEGAPGILIPLAFFYATRRNRTSSAPSYPVERYRLREMKNTDLIAFLHLTENSLIPSGSALDLGCGAGRSSRFLSSFCTNVTGIDSSQEMIAQAVDQDSGGNYLHLSRGNPFPFPDADFDLVFSSWMILEEADEKEIVRILSECRRVLKPDGRCIIVTNTPEFYQGRWLSCRVDHPENESPLHSGQSVKVTLLPEEVTISDTYWSDTDYRRFFTSAGFKTASVHHPLGCSGDDLPWLDELHTAPYVIYVLHPQSDPWSFPRRH